MLRRRPSSSAASPWVLRITANARSTGTWCSSTVTLPATSGSRTRLTLVSLAKERRTSARSASLRLRLIFSPCQMRCCGGEMKTRRARPSSADLLPEGETLVRSPGCRVGGAWVTAAPTTPTSERRTHSENRKLTTSTVADLSGFRPDSLADVILERRSFAIGSVSDLHCCELAESAFEEGRDGHHFHPGARCLSR